MRADSLQCFQCGTHVNHAGCEQHHGGDDDDTNEDDDNEDDNHARSACRYIVQRRWKIFCGVDRPFSPIDYEEESSGLWFPTAVDNVGHL